MDIPLLKSKKFLYTAIASIVVLITVLILTPILQSSSGCNTPEAFAKIVSKVYIGNIEKVAEFSSSGDDLEDVTKQLKAIRKKSNKALHQCKKSFQGFSLKDKTHAKHLTFNKIQNIYGEEVWQNYIKAFATYSQLVDELYDVTNITSIIKPQEQKPVEE